MAYATPTAGNGLIALEIHQNQHISKYIFHTLFLSRNTTIYPIYCCPFTAKGSQHYQHDMNTWDGVGGHGEQGGGQIHTQTPCTQGEKNTTSPHQYLLAIALAHTSPTRFQTCWPSPRIFGDQLPEKTHPTHLPLPTSPSLARTHNKIIPCC